jgi:hypothetical protein
MVKESIANKLPGFVSRLVVSSLILLEFLMFLRYFQDPLLNLLEYTLKHDVVAMFSMLARPPSPSCPGSPACKARSVPREGCLSLRRPRAACKDRRAACKDQSAPREGCLSLRHPSSSACKARSAPREHLPCLGADLLQDRPKRLAEVWCKQQKAAKAEHNMGDALSLRRTELIKGTWLMDNAT